EFNWFLSHRGIQSILLGITDSPDPDGSTDMLFWPEIIQAGLHLQPWYDFRGFRKEGLAGVVKLRDYDEARVQLAADLNDRKPEEIWPIGWRNKVRERQERELAECNDRLKEARGWYERAFISFGQRRYRQSSHYLLKAIEAAPPDRVPDHYPTSLDTPGWSED